MRIYAGLHTCPSRTSSLLEIRLVPTLLAFCKDIKREPNGIEIHFIISIKCTKVKAFKVCIMASREGQKCASYWKRFHKYGRHPWKVPAITNLTGFNGKHTTWLSVTNFKAFLWTLSTYQSTRPQKHLNQYLLSKLNINKQYLHFNPMETSKYSLTTIQINVGSTIGPKATAPHLFRHKV